MYNDFMKADLCNELVEIYNVKYTITNQPVHDPETNTVTCLAISKNNQKVILSYNLLDKNDLECYDIEKPYMIIDADTHELLFERK